MTSEHAPRLVSGSDREERVRTSHSDQSKGTKLRESLVVASDGGAACQGLQPAATHHVGSIAIFLLEGTQGLSSVTGAAARGVEMFLDLHGHSAKPETEGI